jgi:hypothetical protein
MINPKENEHSAPHFKVQNTQTNLSGQLPKKPITFYFIVHNVTMYVTGINNRSELHSLVMSLRTYNIA